MQMICNIAGYLTSGVPWHRAAREEARWVWQMPPTNVYQHDAIDGPLRQTCPPPAQQAPASRPPANRLGLLPTKIRLSILSDMRPPELLALTTLGDAVLQERAINDTLWQTFLSALPPELATGQPG